MSSTCGLFYCSLTHPLTDGALRSRCNAEIYRVSRENNAGRGVTGALLCGAEHFAQLLEGPFNEVMQTISAIRNDPRHRDLVVLRLNAVRNRSLPFWTMAAIDLPGWHDSVAEQLMRRAHQRRPGAADALLRLLCRMGPCDVDSMHGTAEAA